MHGVLQFFTAAMRPLLVPERGEFLAIGHEFGAFAQIGAIDPENLVVGAGHQLVGVVHRPACCVAATA